MSKTSLARTVLANLFSSSSRDTTSVAEFEKALTDYFGLDVFLVNSGRSALYLILKAAGIGEGDEVLIQAYTCNAVPNPIIWTGAKPIYADIKADSLNVAVDDLKKKITERTRAIILQHTFGRPGPIEEVLEITRNKKLLFIEDCAHCLGAEYKGKKLGTYGDAAIFSFGREKVISSLAGGAIIVGNKQLERPISSLVSNLKPLGKTRLSSEFFNFFTWRLLLRRVYFSKTGDKLIKELNKHDFFNVVTSHKEKSGERPAWYPAAMPNIFAKIAVEEFTNLDDYNSNRRKIAEFYLKNIKNPDFKLLPDHEGIYLRFVAFHKDAPKILSEARKKRFWFGNWYNTAVYPGSVNAEKLGYKQGSCPVAEECAEKTINLPNYLGMTTEIASEVVDFINNYK